jgi:hypothetical protein
VGGLAGAAVALTGRAFPYVAAAVLVALAAAGVAHRRRERRVADDFRQRHGPGKDLLLVYTDSPHWRPYIEAHWLPRWGDRAVVLDRSRPWSPDQPEAVLWRSAAGFREHTPLAVVVPPRGPVRVVRFFLAFRDFKHGKDRRLRAAEAELEAALARARGDTR